jgi:hypothetical protein
MAAKWKTVSSFSQNWVLGRFMLLFGLQRSYRIFKTYPETSIPGGSGHHFYFVSRTTWVEKTHLESSDTDLSGFAAEETGFWHDKTSRISVATF